MKLRDVCENVVSFVDKKREREMKQKTKETPVSKITKFKDRVSKLGLPVKK